MAMQRYRFRILAGESHAPSGELAQYLDGAAELEASVKINEMSPTVEVTVDADSRSDARAIVSRRLYDGVPAGVRGNFESVAGSIRLIEVPEEGPEE